MKYKLWILDLDGTAADTVESLAVTANQVLSEEGLKPQPVESYKCFAGSGQFELVKRALRAAGDTELEHYERAIARYVELFKTGCTYGVKPFDGMKEVLELAKKEGVKLAIFSNKRHENVINVVDAAFGTGFFDVVLGQKDSYEKKPSPEGVKIILEELGLEPGDCLYFGDSDVDMQTAHNAGCECVGVTWGFRTCQELDDNDATFIIDNPKEMEQFI